MIVARLPLRWGKRTRPGEGDRGDGIEGGVQRLGQKLDLIEPRDKPRPLCWAKWTEFEDLMETNQLSDSCLISLIPSPGSAPSNIQSGIQRAPDSFPNADSYPAAFWSQAGGC